MINAGRAESELDWLMRCFADGRAISSRARFNRCCLRRIRSMARRVREVCTELEGRAGAFHEASEFGRASLTGLLQELLDRGEKIDCVEVHKGWMEIDSFADYRRAWAELRE